MTPGCVVVDQGNRRMYDAHKCIQEQSTKMMNVKNYNTILAEQALTPTCELLPQPLDLVQGDIPLSMVSTTTTNAGGVMIK